MKKRIAFLLLCCGFLGISYGQITLEYCQQKARKNYPLIKQYDLIEAAKKYNIAQVQKSYVPLLAISGRASWQSDITEFPEEFSGLLDQMGASISFPEQDQYSVALELNQTIWDGGITTSQKKTIKAQNEVEKQNLEVSLYALTEQINQFFFSILLLDEQLLQNELLQKELERNYKLISSYKENGIAQQSDQDEIRVEILSAQQRHIEMAMSKKTFLKMLSAFIGEAIGEEIQMVRPSAEIEPERPIARPELKLFDSQVLLFNTQRGQLWSKGMPRLALFAKGAYADPGLNMFESGFTPYFIGGVQLSWNFGGLYTHRDEKRILDNQKQQVEVQREVFLFNTQQKIDQKESEIEKLKSLLENDDEIIQLRESVQKSSEVKVENGTMSVSDLMRDIHSANMAKQNKIYHEIQLLMAIWELKVVKGTTINK